ncbi:type IV toxin-antitoxin system AbiEi family antitoxin domain-containing protein [Cellulosimicrobium terreum]|nr:type IV toxin-antitoxin system AbiEi family antitoxin domain-containing protein [Cellulosimicrobium terreum]
MEPNLPPSARPGSPRPDLRALPRVLCPTPDREATIRALHRRGELVRLRRGVYAVPSGGSRDEPGGSARAREREHLRNLAAVLQTLSTDLWVSHASADSCGGAGPSGCDPRRSSPSSSRRTFARRRVRCGGTGPRCPGGTARSSTASRSRRWNGPSWTARARFPVSRPRSSWSRRYGSGRTAVSSR